MSFSFSPLLLKRVVADPVLDEELHQCCHLGPAERIAPPPVVRQFVEAAQR